MNKNKKIAIVAAIAVVGVDIMTTEISKKAAAKMIEQITYIENLKANSATIRAINGIEDVDIFKEAVDSLGIEFMIKELSEILKEIKKANRYIKCIIRAENAKVKMGIAEQKAMIRTNIKMCEEKLEILESLR